MKLPVKLQDLIQQGDAFITSISQLMALGNVWIDCSGVDKVPDDKLDLLLSVAPSSWDFMEFSEVIDSSTLTESFAEQLIARINFRLGRVSPPAATVESGDDLEPPTPLDIFNLRDEVISDYRTYIESFLKIRDSKVKSFVDQELEKGELWPDPLVQLNPSYKPGAYIGPLVEQGVLHPDCARYFPDYVSKYPFRDHQEQAFRIARQEQPYVLTTGTGSGKSMTYVVPIIDDLLRNPGIRGVRAILVYPMNALINSQKQEFDKFLGGIPGSRIRVEQYTGQENLTQKTEIQNNPPQIILTNYMMLELMLSRTHEEKLVASSDLKFLVLEDRLLYPLVFCRECGQDYYMVFYNRDRDEIQPLLPTQLDFNPDESDIQEGYLTLNEPGLWHESEADRLPDTWFRETKREGRVPKKEYAQFIPQRLRVLPNGRVTHSLLEGTEFWFSPKPFSVCLNCGIVHDRRKSEFTKLSRLSSEGRSTTTTLLCLSTVNRLKSSNAVEPTAQKVLSFTDNRQDASLQAGHFNDFVQTSLLRAALNRALTAKSSLIHADLVRCVVEQMNLAQTVYAKQPAEFDGPGKRRNERAFQKLVEYRLYEDLRKGWRFVQPNLEQCGLLAIEYDGIEEVCASNSLWEKYPHHILLKATAQERCEVVKAFLDQLRKDLVLDAELLQPENVEQLLREVNQAIADPWSFDVYEKLHEARWATYQQTDQGKAQVKLTARSKIGRFLRSDRAWPWLNQPISEVDYDALVRAFVAALADAGFLLQEQDKIQLRVDSLKWVTQKVTHIPSDPMTAKRLQGSEAALSEVNQFFQNFYEQSSSGIHNLEGREHTGQVKNEKRQEREAKFREGKLATLFCSPTMELGIDISDLNIVHMRNVPPSPANYAQRGGRAGRSGQAALVITYASIGSGHDQYFFRRQDQMVAGVVVPPKLELGNQDLIRAHIHSIWLAHTGLSLENSSRLIIEAIRRNLAAC